MYNKQTIRLYIYNTISIYKIYIYIWNLIVIFLHEECKKENKENSKFLRKDKMKMRAKINKIEIKYMKNQWNKS